MHQEEVSEHHQELQTQQELLLLGLTITNNLLLEVQVEPQQELDEIRKYFRLKITIC